MTLQSSRSSRNTDAMAMYEELVRSACDREAEEDLAVDALLDDVAAARRARMLHPASADAMADQLGAELGYDLALLRLCHHLGWDPDLTIFQRPAAARAALEGYLRRQLRPGAGWSMVEGLG